MNEVSEDTVEARRGAELFPLGPKRVLEEDTQPRQAGEIQDGFRPDGGMPRSKSRRFSVIGFDDESGDDYDEIGSMEIENHEDDVVYQGMNRYRPSRDFGQSEFSSNFSLTSNNSNSSESKNTPSATVTSGALSDPGMFDPLAEEAEAGNTLSREQ